MSSPVLANGRVLGLSHKRRGQYFALDPETGAVLWRSSGGDGENAALIVAGEAVLILQGDGRLLVLPAAASSFEPIASYRVADSSTFAHTVPTPMGLLVKDDTTLSLYDTGAKPASRNTR